MNKLSLKLSLLLIFSFLISNNIYSMENLIQISRDIILEIVDLPYEEQLDAVNTRINQTEEELNDITPEILEEQQNNLLNILAPILETLDQQTRNQIIENLNNIATGTPHEYATIVKNTMQNDLNTLPESIQEKFFYLFYITHQGVAELYEGLIPQLQAMFPPE